MRRSTLRPEKEGKQNHLVLPHTTHLQIEFLFSNKILPHKKVGKSGEDKEYARQLVHSLHNLNFQSRLIMDAMIYLHHITLEVSF